jgi:tRNA threonylcarbamoyladenosine biosynthesis protein TsaB
MKVLSLDSATEACSAAVLCDGVLVAHRFETMRRGHAESLMLLVQDVMQQAGLTFDKLDLIATTVGPGGFTGLRIGLASARGLALAAGVPIVGVTTLEAVARANSSAECPLLIALDSKRADLYMQLFDANGTPLSEPSAMLPAEIGSTLPASMIAVGGNAAGKVLEAFAKRTPPLLRQEGPTLPDAAIVAQIGAERHARMPCHKSPRPLYLRPPDAQKPNPPSK